MKKLDDNFRFSLKMLIMGEMPRREGGIFPQYCGKCKEGLGQRFLMFRRERQEDLFARLLIVHVYD